MHTEAQRRPTDMPISYISKKINSIVTRLVLILLFFSSSAPGASPEMAYVDTPPTTVPPEATYEEDWEVFDPYVNIAIYPPRAPNIIQGVRIFYQVRGNVRRAIQKISDFKSFVEKLQSFIVFRDV